MNELIKEEKNERNKERMNVGKDGRKKGRKGERINEGK